MRRHPGWLDESAILIIKGRQTLRKEKVSEKEGTSINSKAP